MTIRQLKEPCWVLDPSPYDDEYGEPHYKTRAEADDALRELREERGPSPEDLAELEPVKVQALAGPCWVAECDAPDGPDGICGEQYSDEDYGGNHFTTPEEVIGRIGEDGWTYRGGDVDEFWPAPGSWACGAAGLVRCGSHSPEDAPKPPPSPAELEAAGQLRLPGVTS